MSKTAPKPKTATAPKITPKTKESNGIVVRNACVDDVPPILELVNSLAQEQVMLPRSPISVYEGIRDFVVAEVDGVFAGCGALKVVWADLAGSMPSHRRRFSTSANCACSTSVRRWRYFLPST